MEMLVVLGHGEHYGEEKEESIEEVKGDFISMKGNLGSLKNLSGKVIGK